MSLYANSSCRDVELPLIAIQLEIAPNFWFAERNQAQSEATCTKPSIECHDAANQRKFMQRFWAAMISSA